MNLKRLSTSIMQFRAPAVESFSLSQVPSDADGGNSGLPDSSWLAGKQGGREWARSEISWDSLTELGLIVLWAMWVGRAYLNLDRSVWPYGADFPLNVQAYYVWSSFTKCGICVLWNGSINGGAPAFGDPFGPLLHPFVVVATLLWGAVNGAKLALVASLAMAGVAQWWIAKVMRLGFIPRLWVAGLAVTGGHLAGRMEMGWIVMLLSIAAGSLVIAPGLDLALTGRRHAVVLFGITLALAVLAGQAYIQFGVLLGLLPAFLVFLIDDAGRLRPLWKGFALAGVLAILFASIYWVPLLHFQPNYSKSIDVTFSGSQPLQYLPLNLVIRDLPFFKSTALAKKPMPAIYMNYIGWIPVLFAILALRLVPRTDRRLLTFFLTAIALIYLAGSAVTLKPLVSRFSPLAGLRHPALIAALAVPLILSLAGWAVDLLLKFDLGKLTLHIPSVTTVRLKVMWILLVPPLAWGLRSAYDFSQVWATIRVPRDVQQVVQAIELESTQWATLPFGEFAFIPVTLDANLKLVIPVDHRGWAWKGRELPPPFLYVTRHPSEVPASDSVRRVGGISLLVNTSNQYAVVDTGSDRIPCRATAVGGNIGVDCESNVAGTLVVHENQWSGWAARRDGGPVRLGPGQWLNVPAPAGKHHYEFRYRPWDVVLGAILTLAGVLAGIWLWFRPTAWDRIATVTDAGDARAIERE